MEPVVLHVQDSFAALKDCPDRSVDAIITDPPYSEHCQKNLCSGSLVGTKNVPKYELPFPALSSYAFVGDLIRISRRWVVMFCTLEDIGRLSMMYPENYVRGCVWYKPNSMGQLTKDRPATSYEGVALFHSTSAKKRWNGKGSYGIWRCNGTRGKKDRHPNEKPIDLALKLTALFSDRGESVFDPFCGSGTLGEAAVRLGRTWVGLDFDPVWVDRSRVRVAGVPVTDEYALSLCSMKGLDAEQDKERS